MAFARGIVCVFTCIAAVIYGDEDKCPGDVLSFSTPRDISTRGETYGSFGEDPVTLKVYFMDNYRNVGHLVEYPNMMHYLRDSNGVSYTLPTQCAGSQSQVINGKLYCVEQNNQLEANVLVYDLSNVNGVKRIKLPVPRVDRRHECHYPWGGFSDIDIAYDGRNVYILWAKSTEGCRFIISKIDENLDIEYTWNTNIIKPEAGQAFMICKKIYVVKGIVTDTTISFIYDLDSHQTISGNGLQFNSGYGHNGHTHYNPTKQVLYSWDNGHQVEIRVNFKGEKIPVNGGWSSFDSWTVCTLSCGGGTMSRSRTCTNPRPENYGSPCTGKAIENLSCNTQLCPVKGGWGAFTDWTTCSASCGGGVKRRTRWCNSPQPANGGAYCTGSPIETTSCHMQSCPVDGGWSDYSDWQSCTKSCDSGMKTRTRTCTRPSPVFGGRGCSGSPTDTFPCNTQPCPVNGGWSNFSPWSTCSRTCGGGAMTRSRTCTDPSPAHGGLQCSPPESKTETLPCNSQRCPVNGGWSNYGSWQSCTKTCGSGTKTRRRTCTSPIPEFGGRMCSGSASHIVRCNVQECPVHGGWSEFTGWSSCTQSCGGGTMSRNRACTNPRPANGGSSCSGSVSETFPCNTNGCPALPGLPVRLAGSQELGQGRVEVFYDGRWGIVCDDSWDINDANVVCRQIGFDRAGNFDHGSKYGYGNGVFHMDDIECSGTEDFLSECRHRGWGSHDCDAKSEAAGVRCQVPVNGHWSNFTQWRPCSQSCGGGTMSRSRICNNPRPLYGGRLCSGRKIESIPCNTHGCPVNGGWSDFTTWQTCTKSCGGGTSTRTRTCTNPRPIFGGDWCNGSPSEIRPCNTQKCPVNGGWSEYNAWCLCSRSCGGGTMTRKRTCTYPAPSNGGIECTGQETETLPCNTHECAVNGGWSSYTAWQHCTTSCGIGTKTRTRTCTNPVPAFGGTWCSGSSTQKMSCNAQPCPVNGGWSGFTRWSSCSRSCGGGTMVRSRNCTNPSPSHGGGLCAGSATENLPCNTQRCPALTTAVGQETIAPHTQDSETVTTPSFEEILTKEQSGTNAQAISGPMTTETYTKVHVMKTSPLSQTNVPGPSDSISTKASSGIEGLSTSTEPETLGRKHSSKEQSDTAMQTMGAKRVSNETTTYLDGKDKVEPITGRSRNYHGGSSTKRTEAIVVNENGGQASTIVPCVLAALVVLAGAIFATMRYMKKTSYKFTDDMLSLDNPLKQTTEFFNPRTTLNKMCSNGDE